MTLSDKTSVAPEIYYTTQCQQYDRVLLRAKKEQDIISNCRLGVVVLALGASVSLYRMGYYAASGWALVAGVGLFIALAVRHTAVFKRVETYTALVKINRQGVARMQGHWVDFAETGAIFIDSSHPCSADLDLFGKGSLFQYCSTAHTHIGKAHLAELLSGDGSVLHPELVYARQEAVRELANNVCWRQHLECIGCAPASSVNPDKLILWGEADCDGALQRWHVLLFYLLQVATFGAVVAGVTIRGFWFPLIVCIVLQIAFSAVNSSRIFRVFDVFGRNAQGLGAFSRLFGHITTDHFSASLLKDNQAVLNKSDGATAAMKRLGAHVAASEVRFSPLAWVFANGLLLWDVRSCMKLDKWRKRFGKQAREWLSAVGTFEALSSIAVLSFENPQWVTPEVHAASMLVEAENVGHPLISSLSRVTSTFSLGTSGNSVAIITGSNMSGKSTFLRTIGCNCVLAYAGSPVCASGFSCGLFSLVTSMRTGDNLQSHTSTFYAELLRVKLVVDTVRSGIPVLYLLDELFRGTNSADRHDGAVALLQELVLPHTIGCVATHDLALCSLADAHTAYRNYHFRESYDNGEIKFDYRLQDGPSTTRNALYLMKMLGITQ